MNTLTYEEIAVGREESFTVTLTNDNVEMFRQITGDNNLLHTDANYAKSKGFQTKVVYGMLTASFLSALAGMYLPGKYSLIHEVDIKFVKANFINGEPIRFVGRVVEKSDMFKRITLKVRVLNITNETMLRGTMKIGVIDGE